MERVAAGTESSNLLIPPIEPGSKASIVKRFPRNIVPTSDLAIRYLRISSHFSLNGLLKVTSDGNKSYGRHLERLGCNK